MKLQPSKIKIFLSAFVFTSAVRFLLPVPALGAWICSLLLVGALFWAPLTPAPLLSVLSSTQSWIGTALIFLTILVVALCLSTPLFPLFKINSSLSLMFFLLLTVATLYFLSNSFLMFYLAFEFSLVPMTLIILGWGYQTERLGASVALLFYTVAASLPLLMMILKFISLSSLHICNLSFQLAAHQTLLFSLVFSFAFMVKLPIFSFHLWLPKAHVEAPVNGSMFLAAILLKLGGYGMWVVSPALNSYFYLISFSLGLLGYSLVGLICVQHFDSKAIIAYSSVSHMGLALASFTSLSLTGLTGMAWLLLAHGLSSSLLFLLVFKFYTSSHSRSILLSKGLFQGNPLLVGLWFLALITGMGAPPSFNLMAEVISIFSLISNSAWLAPPLVSMAIFLAGVYSFLLYTTMAHRSKFFSYTNSACVFSLDLLSSWTHLFWAMLFILGLAIL